MISYSITSLQVNHLLNQLTSQFTEARPIAIMHLGCSNSEKGFTGKLHSPCFDIDVQVLEVGVAIFSEAVARYLAD